MAAVHDLTQAGCARLNAEMQSESANPPQRKQTEAHADAVRSPMPEPLNNSRFAGMVCRSVGSRLKHATTGKFPLNFTYPLVKWFDGPNDGLVARSRSFGARASHGLNRKAIAAFRTRT